MPDTNETRSLKKAMVVMSKEAGVKTKGKDLKRPKKERLPGKPVSCGEMIIAITKWHH
jgi:hypothetical protein